MIVDMEDYAVKEAEEKALERVRSLALDALKAEERHFASRQFFINMYHGYDEMLRQKADWQSKFTNPIPFFTTEMKASFLYEGVFGSSTGIWEASAINSEGLDKAEMATKLLAYQEQESCLRKEFYTASKMLSIVGDWFLEVYWDRKEREVQLRPRPNLILDGLASFSGFRLGAREKRLIVDKNQPEVRTIPVNAFWIDPKASCLEDARFFCVRREVPVSQLREREKKFGEFVNTEDISGSMPQMNSLFYDTEPYRLQAASSNGVEQWGSSPMEKEDPLVELIQVYYRDGTVESMANRRTWLGVRLGLTNLPCPFVHIKNFAEQGKFHGQSDFASIFKQWRLINKYQNLEADNLLMHFRGYTMVSTDAGSKVREELENLRPGSIVQVNGLGSVQHVRPDVPSPMVQSSKNDLIQQAQYSMGINEILQGAVPSSNVRSTGQFNQLANFGAKILSQSIRNIGYGLKDIGQKWLQLNYEFLDVDQIIPVVGQVGAEFLRVSPEDLPLEAKINVKLSSDLEAAKAQKVQQMMQAMNAAMQIPGFNAPKIAKEIFAAIGGFTGNVDEYFMLPDEQITMMLMQNLMRGGVAQEPVAAGSTVVPDPNQVAQGNSNSGVAEVPSV